MLYGKALSLTVNWCTLFMTVDSDSNALQTLTVVPWLVFISIAIPFVYRPPNTPLLT
ncbi:hypothetical protein N658DRAFT_220257 [Parathielavia hyrcaniae]|uniref:Uncharacterized protein n=1 Tax=Parathielavia hyrcaniae TaxID=113614 RepID=A0AAN6SZ99_9PEZI|nr:hypothetical protein N658DRAFT_220257 [Parathielavia hyrcaniae]